MRQFWYAPTILVENIRNRYLVIIHKKVSIFHVRMESLYPGYIPILLGVESVDVLLLDTTWGQWCSNPQSLDLESDTLTTRPPHSPALRKHAHEIFSCCKN